MTQEITPLENIQRYVQVAMDAVAQEGDTLPQRHERAAIHILQFEDQINQTLLYILRDMEIGQEYQELGFPSLNAWAYTRLAGIRPEDTLSRLCGAVIKLIAPLDATPEYTPEGEVINGLQLIVYASPSALQRTFGTFANADAEGRTKMANSLMTGTSDDHVVKGAAGWVPKIGKAQASFQNIGDDLVDIHIRATRAQATVFEKRNGWLLEIQMRALDE